MLKSVFCGNKYLTINDTGLNQGECEHEEEDDNNDSIDIGGYVRGSFVCAV